MRQWFPEQRFPEQRFLEDVDYDDATIGEMLFNATENKFITPSEKACLLVSRRPCPIDRGNPLSKEWKKVTTDRGNPFVERGQELNTEQAQTRT